MGSGRCIAVRMAAIICARCPGVNRLQSGIYAESAGYFEDGSEPRANLIFECGGQTGKSALR